jgi:hypothetical protein
MHGSSIGLHERCSGRAKTPAAERLGVPLGHRALEPGGAQRRPLRPEGNRAGTTGLRVDLPHVH